MTQEIQEKTRVVTLVSHHGVEAGSVATLNKVISKEMGIIHYGYDEDTNSDKYIGIPLTSLRIATEDEITNIDDHRKIINKKFHIGKKFVAENGYKLRDDISGDKQIITIKDIESFSLMSDKDLFLVEVTNEEENEWADHEILQSLLASSLFIEYNENVEELLADEVGDNGEYVELAVGVRVKLKNSADYGFQNDELVIGTIMDIFEDSTIKLWLNEETKLVMPMNHVYPATAQEINRFGIEKVIDPKLAIGNVFTAKEAITNIFYLADKVKPKQTFKIIAIDTVESYVLQDIFLLEDIINGQQINLSSYDLMSFFDKETFGGNEMNYEKIAATVEEEMVETVEEQEEEEKEGIVTTIEVEDDIQFHSLSINGFKFEIEEDGNIINKNVLNKENLDIYIDSLNKLKKFLK